MYLCKIINLYLNPMINYFSAWNFKSLTTLKVRSNWRGKSTTCTWCHWINLIWTMRPSRYFKYLLPQFSTLLLLFIIQLCHITNGLMSPEDVSRNNFDKNIVNTWLTCFSHNGSKPFLKKHCYVWLLKPFQNKKGPKKNSRCTVFGGFFSAASCKKKTPKTVHLEIVLALLILWRL